MADKDGYRRYLDAAAALGQATRTRAEDLVREMMGGSEVPRAHAQQWVDEIVERGKRATGDLVEIVRTEVSSQLEALGVDTEEISRQLADVLRSTAEAGRRVVVDAQRTAGRSAKSARRRAKGKGKGKGKGKHESTSSPGEVDEAAGDGDGDERAEHAVSAPVKKAPAKKSAAKKSAAKKSAAKKSAAKKTAAKKTAAKKTAAKKTAAKKSAGPASETSPSPPAPATDES
ncbi:MAG: hypothetical protein ACRDWE_00180 [Acidimicrobiales bacterium]